MWNTVVQHLAEHTLPMVGELSIDEFGNRERDLYQNCLKSFPSSYFTLAPYFVDWEL